MPTSSDGHIVDGSLDFSGGVNSLKVTTIQSERVQNGLKRNELSWLINGTTRGGGISPRWGWKFAQVISDSSGVFQGGRMYEPDWANPYLILVISGRVWKSDVETGALEDLSAAFGESFPAGTSQCFFCQAEKWMVIQAGDYVTLPLFWDGTTLRRSKGITDLAVAPGAPGVNEIPAAGPMDYYMNRLWYAQGRVFSAGDMVGGPSGTRANLYRDAVLNVTENPLVIGGDGFTVPTNAGNVRALAHSANLDTALGQSQLFIFTRKSIYSLNVPVTRSDWINSTSNNQPQMRVVQITNGSVNDRSVVAVNGDLFYQSLEPSIRSLFMAIRYFNQWANVAISSNVDRLMQFNDRSLLYASSGIVFDNYLLQTGLPFVAPQGIIHKAIVPLDFAPLSTLSEQLPPVWNGAWDGFDTLQLFSGDFGGRDRAFAAIVSRLDSSIQLWELTNADRFDNTLDTRITWQIETPHYTWDREFDLKKLVSAELWWDRIWGEVITLVEYRPDGDPCWHTWRTWTKCTKRTNCDEPDAPILCYPPVPFCESYVQTETLPLPPIECSTVSGRPSNQLYQVQLRITVKGYCRLRGILVHAEPVTRKLHENMVC